VIRHAIQSRKISRRPGAAPKNHLLLQLPIGVRETLLKDAEYIELPTGPAFARAGDVIAAVYFPDSGLLSLISEMTTGHHLAVAAVGAEGMLGLGVLLGRRHYSCSPVTLVPSRGYLVDADRLLRAFSDRDDVRTIVLAYLGRRVADLSTSAACNRVHSHRQRLARWLLIATEKARQRSLPVTHDTLARMVGGPRHAVTVALNQLRSKGAIAHRRGGVDVLSRLVLVEEACECYTPAGQTVPR
jgi:CRP-like cAMP-binding protein